MTGKVAIVGAGPSGCYTAQALLKAAPGLEVDVIDALPVPYGLVRYGVAADHQGTKAVTRQFDRVFTRMGGQFFGNLRIGADVSLTDLCGAYDAVVLAAGLSADCPLGLPGDDLPGIIGSARLTRALYEHPDAGPLPELGAHPVIIGTGNVAIDILRLLVKTPEELAGSDLGPGPSDWLSRQRVERITIVGRSPAAAARFDPAMIRELATLSRINASIQPPTQGGAGVEGLLATLAETTSGRLPVEFRFQTTPTAVRRGPSGLLLDVTTPNGAETLSASALLTAIGFASNQALTGEQVAGCYHTGWFANGPTGALPRCREEAQALAARILREIAPDPHRPGRRLLQDVPGTVDFAHWQAIDAHEKAVAAPERCRRKLAQRSDLLTLPTLQDV
ncbi:FAD-dependent oxidoreductase [Salipiger sp. PrR007]|uniref:FAD-dependent oxidoreductase n=1 Tax=Salipiger sp. PrR007 TaxID=2706884 RepID=UPI0013BD17ED|nr:FAD-dependent oxidoreductase [Salipiger sp. PrR007]NDW33104.1 FAD-dependent oxidoreductase [Salipiger sp. PrR007]